MCDGFAERNRELDPYYIEYWRYACMCVCTLHAYGAHRRQRRVVIPWNWRCGWLLAIMWVLEIEPGPLEKQLVL